MKKKLRIMTLLLMTMLVAVCICGCASQKEMDRRQADIFKIKNLCYIFGDYLKKSEFKDLDCVITYEGQNGVIIDSPTKIEGDEELARKFFADVTKTYANKMEFSSRGMRKKKYDKVVYTIKDGKVTMDYDRCQ